LARVVEMLREGGAVVLPTDTVYGLAVAASVPGATASVFAIKGRPSSVPLAVLVHSLDEVRSLCEPPTPAVEQVVQRFWPGPLTVVLRRAGTSAALELGGDGSTVGVRCPDHALVRAVIREVGPLATTSANRHGEPTGVTALEVAAALADSDLALIVDGGACAGVASTVIDGTDLALPVLRPGPIAQEQIAAAATARSRRNGAP
jgi:L-threonylcarbamoyladenylate synthase